MTRAERLDDGPRFFAPPNADPIDPNYDPLIWREAGLLGSAMTFELERTQHAGVVSNAIYDYYWPGYEDSAPLGHNTVCLLAEVASARVAKHGELSPASSPSFVVTSTFGTAYPLCPFGVTR